MNKYELGWIIGIIDGEGSIILMNRKYGRRIPRITITSTDIEIMDKCKDILGGYYCKRNDKRYGTKQAYMFVLHGERAIKFLEKHWQKFVHPVKKKRALHVSKYYKVDNVNSFEKEFYLL